jgi:hypothetical protein
MTNGNDRFPESLSELTSAEMQLVHGGDDLSFSPDNSETEIAMSGYIRIKKLNSGG